jgi:RNA polymerase sigma-70 factor (ECF subfamily)
MAGARAIRSRFRNFAVTARALARGAARAHGERMDARALLPSLMPERARFVRLARLRVATEADAEDVVQQALARAADRAGSLHDPARLRPWFYRILRRAIADHHRERPRDPMCRRGDVEPEQIAEEVEPARNPCPCCVRLLAALPPSYADVLRGVDVEGRVPGEVAAALGISLGNLYVRLHRARRTLRARVEEECGVASHEACLDCSCGALERCAEHAEHG